MSIGLLFQLFVFVFIALNILLLAKLFPVEQNHKRKPRPRKI